MNTITNLEASIVSDTPGTTRDVIQQKINLQGLPVTFHDTAGLRKTKNKIEKKGINLALNTIKNSNDVITGAARLCMAIFMKRCTSRLYNVPSPTQFTVAI